MSLSERIDNDLKTAIKAQDSLRLLVLRLIKASSKNKEIEKRSSGADGELTDEEILALIMREAKKRKESIEMFKRGAREDLVQKESSELKILEEYLPKFLSREEIALVVDRFLKTGTYTSKDFGSIIKGVMPLLKGKALGSLVSEVIKEKLAGK